MFDIRKEPINILAIILVLTKWKLNIETHTRTHRNIHVYKQRSKQASTTKDIQSGNKIIYLCSFSNRNLNFILQLFGTEEKLKPWKWIKHQLHRIKQHAVSLPTYYTCSNTILERNYKTICFKFISNIIF